MLQRLFDGHYPLIGLREFADTLGTEQQLRPEGRHGKDRGSVQHVTERRSICAVAQRIRRDGVDRSDEPVVMQCAVVDVDQIIYADPRHPLSTAAESATKPGSEQRPHQFQRAAPRGVHDSGAHHHHPQSCLRRGRGRSLPIGDDVREEAAATGAVFAQRRIAAIESVVADGRSATNTRGPFDAPPAAAASLRVGSIRLSRMMVRCASVNRPAIDAPARWMTASTSSSRSGAGHVGSQRLLSDPAAAVRIRRMTRWPPVVRNDVSADPTSPDAPVTATVRGRIPVSAASRWTARSAASWRWR